MIRRAGFAALIAIVVLAALAPSALAAKQKGGKDERRREAGATNHGDSFRPTGGMARPGGFEPPTF